MKKLLCLLLVLCLSFPVLYHDVQAEALGVFQDYPNQVALGLAIAAVGKGALTAAWSAAMTILPAAAGVAMLGVVVAMAVANDSITTEDAQNAAKSLKKLSNWDDYTLCDANEFRIVKRTDFGLMFVDNVCWNVFEAFGLAYVGLDIWTLSSTAALECAMLLGEYERCLVIAGSYQFNCDLRNNMILGENHGVGKYNHFHVVAPNNNPNTKRYVNPTKNHIFYGEAIGGGYPS